MNPQDLRIGNYILDHKGIIRIVEYTATHSIGLLNDSGGTSRYEANPIWSGNMKDLKGIPLKEELLVKCGFEVKSSKWYDKKYFTDCELDAEVMCISVNASSFRCAIYDVAQPSPTMTGTIIQYLHELQNLIKALTGTELKVDL